MIDAVQVGHTHFVGLLPEKIDDIDSLALLIDKEHRSQPSLLIDRFAFDAQFHSFTAGFDAEVRNRWIVAQFLRDAYAFGELRRCEKLLRLPLDAREGKHSIPSLGAQRAHEPVIYDGRGSASKIALMIRLYSLGCLDLDCNAPGGARRFAWSIEK